MEQYEECFRSAHYADSEQLELDSGKSPFAQYAFFGDAKLTHIVQAKQGKITINLHALYPDLDIAESLANILGKTIRHRTADVVAFTDDSTSKINPNTMTESEKREFIAHVKPYLW